MKPVAVAAVLGFLVTHLLIEYGPVTVGLLIAFLSAVYVGLDVLRYLSRTGYRAEREKVWARREAEHGLGA